MRFIRFLAFFACFFSINNIVFAAEYQIIPFVLTGGETIGKPDKFYMNKTMKFFCADDKCASILTQLTQLPTGKQPYVGSMVDGFPLIDRDGKFMISNDLFQRDINYGKEYYVKNLFYSGEFIRLDLAKEGFNVYPTSVILESLNIGWLDEKTKTPVTKLSILPSADGKVFIGYSTGSDINSELAIDRNGNILSQAKFLKGDITLYTRWARLINCKSKTYLPAYSDTCKECLENNWCPGGNFEEKYIIDQGMNACPFGLVSEPASYSPDQCKTPDPKITIVCQPGNYLPAYGKECAICKEKNWCPGGVFYYKTAESGKDSGINVCPNEGTSNAGSDSINKCYMPGLPVSIDHGSGTYSCFWYSIGYTSNCFNYKIECEKGYHIDSSNFPILSCALDGTACGTDPNVLEYDSNCIPIKCKDTHHLEDKKCVENVRTCPIENGLGRQEWMKDNILGGKWTMCTAYLCNPGYTSERYLTNETSKPCGECKNRRDKSGNIVVSAWKETNCEIATCMYQGELYRYDNNTCVQICDTAGREDITGKMVWDPLSEKCERTCKPGFTNW